MRCAAGQQERGRQAARVQRREKRYGKPKGKAGDRESGGGTGFCIGGEARGAPMLSSFSGVLQS